MITEEKAITQHHNYLKNSPIKDFIDRLKTVKQQETRYDFLDVIKKADSENLISDWLAFLLDAKKCSSELPLKLLCKKLDTEYYGGEAEILREYAIDSNRRIDIFIRLETVWIVIENKINSFEHDEQTRTYKEAISDKAVGQNVDLRYVYLKPKYNKSEPVEKDFRTITYDVLYDCWKGICSDDFAKKEYYVYFDEFIKIVSGRYAMCKELSFHSNTNLYVEYREQFACIEEAFNDDCKNVREKLNEQLKNVFPDKEGWAISSHSTYIQFYTTNWGGDIHFEIGVWGQSGISFNRLIADSVEIEYCLHAERDKAALYKNEFQNIEQKHRYLFGKEKYNFGCEDCCIDSIDKIAKRLQDIKNEIYPEVDSILMTNKV